MNQYSAQLAYSDEDEGYVATSAEFPGLSGTNPDPKVALGELREAIELAVASLIEDGEQAPQPLKMLEHSGQFRLRVPRSLHAQLVRQAASEQVSLNTYAVSLLSAGLGQAPGQRRRRV